MNLLICRLLFFHYNKNLSYFMNFSLNTKKVYIRVMNDFRNNISHRSLQIPKVRWLYLLLQYYDFIKSPQIMKIALAAILNVYEKPKVSTSVKRMKTHWVFLCPPHWNTYYFHVPLIELSEYFHYLHIQLHTLKYLFMCFKTINWKGLNNLIN